MAEGATDCVPATFIDACSSTYIFPALARAPKPSGKSRLVILALSGTWNFVWNQKKNSFQGFGQIIVKHHCLIAMNPNTAEVPLIPYWSASLAEVGHMTLCNCFLLALFPPRRFHSSRNVFTRTQSSLRFCRTTVAKIPCFHYLRQERGNLSSPETFQFSSLLPQAMNLPHRLIGDSV